MYLVKPDLVSKGSIDDFVNDEVFSLVRVDDHGRFVDHEIIIEVSEFWAYDSCLPTVVLRDDGVGGAAKATLISLDFEDGHIAFYAVEGLE